MAKTLQVEMDCHPFAKTRIGGAAHTALIHGVTEAIKGADGSPLAVQEYVTGAMNAIAVTVIQTTRDREEAEVVIEGLQILLQMTFERNYDLVKGTTDAAREMQRVFGVDKLD